ncbi:DUF2335 domain-containing protein [Pseudoramibacter alactolyticus]|uniref:DUF2335 domain-containing protein n=1 Tax=Pseudoramibacter alactolyticus TaxID=113287 RepID=UPI0028E57A52|nr:DUF2335 domain-containing protein [Pseudoramibacter alactolyticus]
MNQAKKKPPVSQKNGANGQLLTKEELIRQLEDMPEEEREAVLVQAEGMEMLSFSGPLPPPQILKQYSEILPEAPREIFDMAEKETKFRHEYEKKEQKMRSRDSFLGMLFAFILCMVLIGSGVWVIVSKSAFAGTVLSGFGIASVIVTFIRGTRPQKKE